MKSIRILYSQVNKLHGNNINMVKILWDLILDYSIWEIEEKIKESHTSPFLGKTIFKDENFRC